MRGVVGALVNNSWVLDGIRQVEPGGDPAAVRQTLPASKLSIEAFGIIKFNFKALKGSTILRVSSSRPGIFLSAVGVRLHQKTPGMHCATTQSGNI